MELVEPLHPWKLCRDKEISRSFFNSKKFTFILAGNLNILQGMGVSIVDKEL
jgi:hypothetical protein